MILIIESLLLHLYFQGLTETVASLSIQALDDSTLGVVGPPTKCVEVKLKSTPDITDKAGVPYLSTDKHDVDGNVVYGRGEVCVKGVNVLVGYYKMPEETNKVKDKDGPFLLVMSDNLWKMEVFALSIV